jgi:hypothetical protein
VLSTPARRVWLFALVGAAVGVIICLSDLRATHDTLGGLVAGTEDQPQTALIHLDLPDEPTNIGGAHDGLYYYAVARNPFDLVGSARFEDRPRYRYQRILFPVAAWVLHPTGGGPGLLWTMFLVNAVGLVVGGVATGLLSTSLRGPPWPALLFGLFYGSIVSLRITVPDALALALVIAALALSLRRHHLWAVLAATAAVLTKEPIWLVLAGFGLWRRDREGLAITAVPAAVAGAWWLVLARMFPGPAGVSEFVAPFEGWRYAIHPWLEGFEPLAWVSALLGLGLGIAAIVRTRPSHPLWWAIVVNLVVLAFYSPSVITPERNISRIVLPIQVLGVVALVTSRADRRVIDAVADEHHVVVTAPVPGAAPGA